MTEAVDVVGLTPSVRPIDLTFPRRVHVVGIGGAGMRAIARVLVSMGHTVSGSDGVGSQHLATLERLGIRVAIGHHGDHIGDADFVTRSSAVADDNPEVVAAGERGLQVCSRAEVLSAISAHQPSILVAGTHGKTTTSSMLAVILDHAGREPSFIIGSDVRRFGTGARWSAETEMIIEADESDGTFLALHGDHAIVTSLDPDHLEYFGSRRGLDAAFAAFVEGIGGITAVCIDAPGVAALVDHPGVITYGTDRRADLCLTKVQVDRSRNTCSVRWGGAALGEMSIGLPGHHNALNAAGAAALALELGVSFSDVRDALEAFGGIARRFERRGAAAGVAFIDDYAHLPAEVEAAIDAASSGGWRRVVVAYQPHRYSRTQDLGHTFAGSFDRCDHLVLTGIYPSGEAPREGVTGRIVHDAVVAASPGLSVTYQETLGDLTRHLTGVLQPGDLCLTLGAGDLTAVPDRVIAALHTRWAGELDRLVPASSILVNEPLGPRTTYRVGGHAQALAEVSHLGDLRTVVAEAARVGVPTLVIGKGSNLLVSDTGFEGLALSLVGEFEDVRITGSIVVAGAAVPLPALARQSVAAGLTGFEWAVGVPGSIGGAIAMNAGGHGADMAASLVEAAVLNATTGRLETWSTEQCDFGYRRSAVTGDHIVVQATLELAEGDSAAGRDALAEIVRWRRDNQPGGQNAGSVFTNPGGDSAGRLIDQAGCKGMRIGSAEVSDKHANFIQVDAGGSADDVFALMGAVAEQVERRCEVRLVPETRLVGFAAFPGPVGRGRR